MDIVTISMRYKLFTESNWREVDFLADEYFDLDPGELAEWNSVPWHDDLRDYLDWERASIQYVEAIILDSSSNISKNLRFTFWNKGKNKLVEVRISGSKSLSEMILTIEVQENPEIIEIIRFHDDESFPVIKYHGFFHINKNGSEEEVKINTDM